MNPKSELEVHSAEEWLRRFDRIISSQMFDEVYLYRDYGARITLNKLKNARETIAKMPLEWELAWGEVKKLLDFSSNE